LTVNLQTESKPAEVLFGKQSDMRVGEDTNMQPDEGMEMYAFAG
jgi:hypothetical protein